MTRIQNIEKVLSRHPRLSEFILKLPSHSRSCLTSLRHSRSGAAFRRFKVFTLPLRSSHLLRVSSTPRHSHFRRFQLWTWTSNNTSSLISIDSYATPSFSTFITCNVSINTGNYAQWQIFRHTIPTNQRRWSQPLQQIQHVKIVQLQQSINSASTSASISCKYYSSSPRRRGRIPNTESTHPITLAVFMC